MANITTEITESNFEKIRDRICQILTLELAEQKTITSDTLFDAVVWKERFIAFDKNEMPSINVYFTGSNLDGHTVQSSINENSFNIDLYVSAKHINGIDGDKLASLKLQKLLRVCNYILSNPHYYRLDFDAGFVRNRHISDMQIAQPKDKDAVQIINGRLSMKVTAGEDYGNVEPVEASGYDTRVKLNETEKGFYYKTNN